MNIKKNLIWIIFFLWYFYCKMNFFEFLKKSIEIFAYARQIWTNILQRISYSIEVVLVQWMIFFYAQFYQGISGDKIKKKNYIMDKISKIFGVGLNSMEFNLFEHFFFLHSFIFIIGEAFWVFIKILIFAEKFYEI